MEKRAHFSVWYFVAAFFLMVLIQNYWTAPHVETLTYSEFKKLVGAGKVNEAVIGTERIVGKIQAEGLEALLPAMRVSEIRKSAPKPHPFVTLRVDDPKLVEDLQKANVSFSARYESKWFSTLLSWILPALIFVVVWSFLFKRMGAGARMMTLGKSKAKVYVQEDIGVTFRDVAGVEEAKEELVEVVDYLKHPEKLARLGAKIPKGVLLVGPPGTGKTLLAKAVAGEAGVPFFSLSGSDFVEMFVGLGAARVRDLFQQAEQKAPCIIFIDELDALGKARGVNTLGGHDEREQTLNQLLSEMDGFDTKKGVILLAATNRPETLDPALLRPGRFDRQVVVDCPDVRGRLAILRVHAKRVRLAPDVDLEVVAARTPGFAGADLANLVNEAALLAARRGKETVGPQEFDDAIDRVIAGLEKKSRVMKPEEKRRVAYHEAGHAIVAELTRGADRVHKVSIIPRGVAALGYTQQLPENDRYLLTESELKGRIQVLLGGRAGEEVVFGEVSTGAQNDLQRATDLALRMVKEFGMSRTLGLRSFEPERKPIFLNVGVPSSKDYSETTAGIIDDEVRAVIDEAYAEARTKLSERGEALERVADRLLSEEVLDGKELRAMLVSTMDGESDGKAKTPPDLEKIGSPASHPSNGSSIRIPENVAT
ncbi:MAG: ATP-dependent zinc metalloprotease FtsH [Nitrospinota bacterium]